jgi:hypothetical protein
MGEKKGGERELLVSLKVPQWGKMEGIIQDNNGRYTSGQ